MTRDRAALLAGWASTLLTSGVVTVGLMTAPAATAQGQPCTWNYSFDAQGNALATYCGKAVAQLGFGSSADNNAALASQAANGAGPTWRYGFAARGDGPPLLFRPQSAPCSLNGGAGDGGSQVPSSDGGCWLASFPTLLDLRFWGAKNDGSADIVPAWNAETAYCVSQRNFTIGGSEAPGCTVYLAAGYYKAQTTLHVAPNISVKADPGALIQLSA
ncbi:MAG TPA: hypothetical protein VGG68_09315, partial [Caulobacteraceae bacterium]